MFQDTQPAALGDDSLPAWREFRVDNSAEVNGLLRQLRETATPVVLSAPGGVSFVTELWTLDRDNQRLGFSANDHDPAVRRLVDADEAVAVGYLDSVKLQFDVTGLMLVRGARSCALQAHWPSTLYRFQRRSSYRVRLTASHAPVTRLRHPAMPDMRLALRIIDLSIGGCALHLPDDVPGIEPGLTLHSVQFDFDGAVQFTTSMQIQHLSAVEPQGTGRRIGCAWNAIDREAERALQRYIDQTQKRRRLLSLD